LRPPYNPPEDDEIDTRGIIFAVGDVVSYNHLEHGSGYWYKECRIVAAHPMDANGHATYDLDWDGKVVLNVRSHLIKKKNRRKNKMKIFSVQSWRKLEAALAEAEAAHGTTSLAAVDARDAVAAHFLKAYLLNPYIFIPDIAQEWKVTNAAVFQHYRALAHTIVREREATAVAVAGTGDEASAQEALATARATAACLDELFFASFAAEHVEAMLVSQGATVILEVSPRSPSLLPPPIHKGPREAPAL